MVNIKMKNEFVYFLIKFIFIGNFWKYIFKYYKVLNSLFIDVICFYGLEDIIVFFGCDIVFCNIFVLGVWNYLICFKIIIFMGIIWCR